MNTLYKSTIALLMVFLPFAGIAGDPPEGHDIKITVKGFKEGSTCILGNYYGDKQYIKDSAKVGPKGEVIFKGKDKYPEGIYLLIPDNKKYFDLVMDENQHFTLESDTIDYINNMKVKGSEENNFFYSYQKFIVTQQKLVEPLRAQLKTTKDKDSIKMISDKITKIDNDVRAYKQNFVKNNPKSFIAKLFTAMEDPVIPETPTLPNGKKDTLFPYHYYKAHFFDNIDFTDDRLLRSPIFHPKVKQYMDKMTAQMPDSINVSADYLVEKARNNPEIFKWMVYWLTLTYESSQIMGMDAVFVHMVEKYYVTNQAYWVDSAQLAKITARAYTLNPILIGKKAPPIIMNDSTGKAISMYDVKAKYTVVIFWDAECGHCKKEVPKLKELYESKLKPMGVQVYAIASENKPKEWKKFIIDNKLHWINVFQPDDYKRAVTKKIYDIYSTPFIYLLDENKIIKAKHIDVDQLGDFIDILEKEKEKEKKDLKK
ncbi:MAG TPA: redoxin domain-containing protein [Bacteroidia bacterium]|nr:redoxin domain-containing protein [Bacteroidia bacterium]